MIKNETIFISEKYPWLQEYLESKPGVVASYKKEWEWLRFLLEGKQFAVICTPDEKYKEHQGRPMTILKTDPAEAELLRQEYEDIVPGFYSDKRTWISVYLDGTISDELLKNLCDAAYQLAFDKLTKKKQKELLDNIK